jgi:hypothetical protein
MLLKKFLNFLNKLGIFLAQNSDFLKLNLRRKGFQTFLHPIYIQHIIRKLKIAQK